MILAKSTVDPDKVIAFELFASEEAKANHYNTSSTEDETNEILEVMGDMAKATRDEVHVYSSNMTVINELLPKNNFYAGQPGCYLRMPAKAGKGKDLFEFTTELHKSADPDGPTDWLLLEKDDDPDMLLGFEFYKDQGAFDRHYSDAEIDKNHDEVIALLGGMPYREDIHVKYSNNQ
ncbi:hypothetical protein [Lentilactobacillus kosonis]|uniref:ABM domain-containing protein n=1 Tax=Lentilactobacillus kosonis TaxID=2810561 RepID=A0A401FNR2_9LACO|nr:hypothetical protein [Lentilactobacillus kosonis]GAY74035.1 hypothetical protein NBRC111893_2181 [Lentilactobacillus kosonis]